MGERRHWHKWAWRLASGVLLVLAVGCRVPPPNVRPPEPPQEYNKPPDLTKYGQVEWPKVALEDPNGNDPLRQGPANAIANGMSQGLGGMATGGGPNAR